MCGEKKSSILITILFARYRIFYTSEPTLFLFLWVCLCVLNSQCIISLFQYSICRHRWLHQIGQWLFSQRACHYAQWVVWQVWPNCQGESFRISLCCCCYKQDWPLSLLAVDSLRDNCSINAMIRVVRFVTGRFLLNLKLAGKIWIWQLNEEALSSYQALKPQ